MHLQPLGESLESLSHAVVASMLRCFPDERSPGQPSPGSPQAVSGSSPGVGESSNNRNNSIHGSFVPQQQTQQMHGLQTAATVKMRCAFMESNTQHEHHKTQHCSTVHARFASAPGSSTVQGQCKVDALSAFRQILDISVLHPGQTGYGWHKCHA